MNFNKDELAGYIDHTILKKGLNEGDIEKVCKEAIEYGFYGVCIYPEYLNIASKMLKDEKPRLVSVLDFPKGEASFDEKKRQAENLLKNGVAEIDMVMNRNLLFKKDYEGLYNDILSVVEVSNVPVKVILETSELTKEEIVISCLIAHKANASFIKTSTGLSNSGAKVEDIELIKKTIDNKMKIKASGGIRDLSTMISMIDSGADRIGTSSSIKIINEIHS